MFVFFNKIIVIFSNIYSEGFILEEEEESLKRTIPIGKIYFFRKQIIF